jgi:hypothetical protein
MPKFPRIFGPFPGVRDADDPPAAEPTDDGFSPSFLDPPRADAIILFCWAVMGAVAGVETRGAADDAGFCVVFGLKSSGRDSASYWVALASRFFADEMAAFH